MQQQIDGQMKLMDVPPGCVVMVTMSMTDKQGRGFAVVRTDRVVFVQLGPTGEWIEGMSSPPRPLAPGSAMAHMAATVLVVGHEDTPIAELRSPAAHAVLRRMVVPEVVGDEVRFRVAGTLLTTGVRIMGGPPDASMPQAEALREQLIAWLLEQGLGATSHELHALQAFATAGQTIAEPGRFVLWQGVPPGTMVRDRDNRFVRVGTHGFQVCFNGAWLDQGAEPTLRPWDGFGDFDIVEVVGSYIHSEDPSWEALHRIDELHAIGVRLKRLREEWPDLRDAVQHVITFPEPLAEELFSIGMRARDVTPTNLGPLLCDLWTLPMRETQPPIDLLCDRHHMIFRAEKPRTNRPENWALLGALGAQFELAQLREAVDEVLKQVSGRSDVDPVMGLRYLLDQIRE